MTVPDNRALASNFSLYELATTNHRSLWAANLREAVQPENLRKLGEVATLLLQPIRDHFGAAVIVNSGFRGETLNTAIGGSKTSQHRKAEAADFRVAGVDLRTVFDWIRLESGIPFGQLIMEGAEPDRPTWIHISIGEPYRPASRCGQTMTWDRVNGYRTVH
jgi:hypothetical protein